MKTVLFISILLFALVNGNTYGQINEYRKFPGQISFVYPIGTSGKNSTDFEYNFSLNALTGSTGQIKGCEIGGILNINQGNMTGVQLGGIGNITKGNVKGLQTGGIFCMTDSMTGLQIGGIFNKAGVSKGAQISGISNINDDSLKGAQISGIYNHTKTLNGVQIGLINYADSVESGISIGLISIVKKNYYDEWTLSASDYQNIGFSYKSGRKEFYNIYNIGANFRKDFLWVGGLGFGHISELNSFLSFQPEIMMYTYLPQDFRRVRETYTTHLKLGFTGNLSDDLSITLAPSVYYYWKSNEDRYDQYGYDISPIPSFMKFNSANGINQHGLGYGISVGLNFK